MLERKLCTSASLPSEVFVLHANSVECNIRKNAIYCTRAKCNLSHNNIGTHPYKSLRMHGALFQSKKILSLAIRSDDRLDYNC